jgi:hypothetical protein
MHYDFQMQIDGEEPFDVYRFGWDPKGFHDEPRVGAESDSLTAGFLGRRKGLQTLCGMIETMNTMLFIKPSDLVTVRLVELYLRNQTLDHLSFIVTEVVTGRRTTNWVASLSLKDVSIVNLWTRQRTSFPGLAPLLIDRVALQADKAFPLNFALEETPPGGFRGAEVSSARPWRAGPWSGDSRTSPLPLPGLSPRFSTEQPSSSSTGGPVKVVRAVTPGGTTCLSLP